MAKRADLIQSEEIFANQYENETQLPVYVSMNKVFGNRVSLNIATKWTSQPIDDQKCGLNKVQEQAQM